MTYAIGMMVRNGIVLLSDSVTNSGIDHAWHIRKSETWAFSSEGSGKRPDSFVGMLSVGNLATAQSVQEKLRNKLDEIGSGNCTFVEAVGKNGIFSLAQFVGASLHEIGSALGDEFNNGFEATFIMGGRIGGESARLFLIYSVGNFIEAKEDFPYLQIGETKYGRVFLNWFVTHELKLEDAATVGLLAMDTTSRLSLAVGPPYDLAVLSAGSTAWLERRIGESDERLLALSRKWNENIRILITDIPPALNISELDKIDVFISYKSEERELAADLSTFLESKGFSVWWDINLVGGDRFRTAIEAKLEAARAVIVIWTRKSVKSDFVLDEADQARGQGKLIPTRDSEVSVRELPLGHRQLQTLLVHDKEAIMRALQALGVGPHT